MTDTPQTFRQPLVTSTGIILGFLLNFAATWVKSETTLTEFGAYSVGILILIGIISLIIALHRSLSHKYSKENSEQYYETTLKIFTRGLVCSFLGVMIDMASNFMS